MTRPPASAAPRADAAITPASRPPVSSTQPFSAMSRPSSRGVRERLARDACAPPMTPMIVRTGAHLPASRYAAAAAREDSQWGTKQSWLAIREELRSSVARRRTARPRRSSAARSARAAVARCLPRVAARRARGWRGRRLHADGDARVGGGRRARPAACGCVERRIVAGEPDLPYSRGIPRFPRGTSHASRRCSALEHEPDVIFCDGHGVVHERGLGTRESRRRAARTCRLSAFPRRRSTRSTAHPGAERGDYYVLTKEWGAQGASIRLQAHVQAGVRLARTSRATRRAPSRSPSRGLRGRHRVPEPLQAADTASKLARRGL